MKTSLGTNGTSLAARPTCQAMVAVLVLSAATATAAGPAIPNHPPFKLTPTSPCATKCGTLLRKGLACSKEPDTNGFWSTPDHPALIALVLDAFEILARRDAQPEPGAVKKGYGYLMSCVQPDGGIYRKELASYNTSVALMVVLSATALRTSPLSPKPGSFSLVCKSSRAIRTIHPMAASATA